MRRSRFAGFMMEIVQIAMVYLGVLSALLCTMVSLQISYDGVVLWSVMAGAAVLFYGLFSVLETFRRGKLYGILGLLIFYLALAIRFRAAILQGIVTLINSFLKEFMNYTGSNLNLLRYRDTDGVNIIFSNTLVISILGVFLIAIVSAFFYRRRRSGVFLIATLPFMMIPLLVGKLGSFRNVYIYLVILVAVIGTRHLKTDSTDRKIRQKLSVILIVVGIVSGFAAYLIMPPARYERGENKILQAQNTVSALSKWDSDDIFTWIKSYFGGDVLSYGKIGGQAEITQSGDTLIKLSKASDKDGSTKKNADTGDVSDGQGQIDDKHGLYLKSYVGEIYDDNKWSQIKKKSEYKKDLAALSSINVSPDSWHIQLRNELGDNAKSSQDNLWDSATLHIRNIGFGYGNYAVPVLPAVPYVTQDNGKSTLKNPGIDYTIEYFTVYPSEVRKDVISAPDDLADEAFWSSTEVKRAGMTDFAKKYYLQVPDSLGAVTEEFKAAYPGLENQLKEADGDISHALKAVKEFISAEAVYTTAPGRTPSDRETVEYFLHDSKKGYCTYFATAATLLLRSVGVPARYVEGLYVSKEELADCIADQEIEIPDYDAHAWVEVYSEKYGFTTFEATPGRGETDNTEQGASGDGGEGNSDNIDSSDQSSADGNSSDADVTPPPKDDMVFDDIDGNEDEPDETESAGTDKGSGDVGRVVLFVVIGIIVFIVLLVVVLEMQAFIRRFGYRKRLMRSGHGAGAVRVIHRHMTPVFISYGIRYTGQISSDLSDAIAESIGIDEGASAVYVSIIFHAAFGPDDISNEEFSAFSDICDGMRMKVYKDSRLLKKLKYRYIHAL